MDAPKGKSRLISVILCVSCWTPKVTHPEWVTRGLGSQRPMGHLSGSLSGSLLGRKTQKTSGVAVFNELRFGVARFFNELLFWVVRFFSVFESPFRCSLVLFCLVLSCLVLYCPFGVRLA